MLLHLVIRFALHSGHASGCVVVTRCGSGSGPSVRRPCRCIHTTFGPWSVDRRFQELNEVEYETTALLLLLLGVLLTLLKRVLGQMNPRNHDHRNHPCSSMHGIVHIMSSPLGEWRNNSFRDP
jgi:hypothetical protein